MPTYNARIIVTLKLIQSAALIPMLEFNIMLKFFPECSPNTLMIRINNLITTVS